LYLSQPIPKNFEGLTANQLIEIILTQQKLIEELRHQGSTSPSLSQKGTETTGPIPAVEVAVEVTDHAPYLSVHPKGGTDYVISLAQGMYWSVGREVDNTIVLTDQWMSRNHAILQAMETGEIHVIDLGSRNGTFINGRRLSIPTPLQDGDVITFGQTNITFHQPNAPLVQDRLAFPGTIWHKRDEPQTNALHLRRRISVLVVDIREFTKLTRSLEEQVLAELVGTWFRRAGEIIREHGSWVDKYIGDAIMAVWIHGSWEVTHTEIQQPFLALRALQQMTQELHHTYPLSAPLRIGAGMNTGFAMVGNTGSGDRPDYTALGDTVNAAFRLETSTKQLGIDLAIGATTYQSLCQNLNTKLPFQTVSVHLKGHDLPMIAYGCHFPDLQQWL
jgi:adenylate cyclase